MSNDLHQIAQALVEPGKGILAADESLGTIQKRFDKINLESTEENRRSYRELLLTAPDIGKYISGVILFDETIRQKTADGIDFVKVMEDSGVIPGIKVDQGAVAMESSAGEKVTNGLEGLPQRLEEYAKQGAKFAKWRAVITIGKGLPTEENLKQNTKDLAQYAKNCQNAGIVPIVEPEVLMDGSHTIKRCEEVSRQTLTILFEELEKLDVDLKGLLLKTNMVISGKESGEDISSEQIAEETVNLFKEVLPNDLPGQVFLSGGQSEQEATQNLDSINKLGPFPWKLSFSYGRALQASAIETWQGKAKNVKAAQDVFIKRAKLNSLATLGQYSSNLE